METVSVKISSGIILIAFVYWLGGADGYRRGYEKGGRAMFEEVIAEIEKQSLP